MDWTFFQLFSQDNIWSLLAPELLLVGGGLFFLTLNWFFNAAQAQWLVCTLTSVLFALGLALISLKLFLWEPGGMVAFSGLIRQTAYTDIFRLFFLLSGFLTVQLARRYFSVYAHLNSCVFYSLLLGLIAALMALVQAYHFISLFIFIEVATVLFYILIAYHKTSILALEASVKYFVLGALSSPILLMGIALLYGASTQPQAPACILDGMSFTGLHIFIAAHAHSPLVLLGACLVLVAIGFKIGAFPLQMGLPDVYQGANLPTTALLAVASKSAGFMVLMALLHGPFAGLHAFLTPILTTVATITLIIGHATACTQRKTQRLIAFSGIAHAGYLLLGVVASLSIDWAAQAILFYLFIYLLSNYMVFGVMAWVLQHNQNEQAIQDFDDLAQRNGFLAFVLTLGLASLAGVPPLAGFIAKFLLLVAIYQAQLYTALSVAVLGVVVSIYYYFGWARAAVFKTWDQQPLIPIHIDCWSRWVLCALSALVLVLGFFPGLFGLLF